MRFNNFFLSTIFVLTFIAACGGGGGGGGANTATQDITISITNLNDNAPVFTSSSIFSAAENQTSIGTVTASDADNDSITFTISGSEIAITSAGVLSFISAPDYETKSSYTATVTATFKKCTVFVLLDKKPFV